jgi:hypothetical protein
LFKYIISLSIEAYIILFFSGFLELLVLDEFLLHEEIVLDALQLQQTQLALCSGEDWRGGEVGERRENGGGGEVPWGILTAAAGPFFFLLRAVLATGTLGFFLSSLPLLLPGLLLSAMGRGQVVRRGGSAGLSGKLGKTPPKPPKARWNNAFQVFVRIVI